MQFSHDTVIPLQKRRYGTKYLDFLEDMRETNSKTNDRHDLISSDHDAS